MNAIIETKLQRFIGNKEAELLCFYDASSKAYETTIYLRCQETGQAIINLIFSKSRIAPLKETSLPRLELLAVLIGTRSINFITQSLQLEIHRKTLWTDSQYVLHWLKSKKILTRFVQRKIDQIRSNKGIKFRCVSTDKNPADITSRGCTVKMLNGNEFWWHGPTWLRKDHDDWPTWNVGILSKDIMDAILTTNKGPKTLYEVSFLAQEDLADNKQEDKKEKGLANNKQEDRKEDAEKNQPSSFEIKRTNYSSVLRLLCVTAWPNRCIQNKRTKEKQKDWLDDKELKKIHERYKHARRNKETNIFAKENSIGQRY